MSTNYYPRRPGSPSSSWSGIKATGDVSKVVDPLSHRIKPGIKLVGYVTKNHASTIVKKHLSKNGKTYLSFVGTTHSLPKKTQAALAYSLDNPNIEKAIIYDSKKVNKI